MFRLQESLMEFGAVFWVDIKVRFQSQIHPDLKKHVLQYGLAAWTRDSLPTSANTHSVMFKYFNKSRQIFQSQPMVQPVPGLYVNIELLHRIMGLWISCALEENCISPVGARNSLCTNSESNRLIATCHQYATSAFNIALENIFSNSTIYIPKWKPFTMAS